MQAENCLNKVRDASGRLEPIGVSPHSGIFHETGSCVASGHPRELLAGMARCALVGRRSRLGALTAGRAMCSRLATLPLRRLASRNLLSGRFSLPRSRT